MAYCSAAERGNLWLILGINPLNAYTAATDPADAAPNCKVTESQWGSITVALGVVTVAKACTDMHRCIADTAAMGLTNSEHAHTAHSHQA